MQPRPDVPEIEAFETSHKTQRRDAALIDLGAWVVNSLIGLCFSRSAWLPTSGMHSLN